MGDAYQRLGIKAVSLLGDAAVSLQQGDDRRAYSKFAESLNLQRLLRTSPDIADRTAALMTELASAVDKGDALRDAERARLKGALAALELDAAACAVEAELIRLREDEN